MSHKETKIGRREVRTFKQIGVDNKVSLQMTNNVTRVGVENTRLQMIDQLVFQPHKDPYTEFASYFYGNPNNSEPLQSLTSHEVKSTIKRRSVNPTYPLVGLRWNPHVETSSIENFTKDFEGPIQYSCRCNNCDSNRCPSRFSSSSTLRPGVFKTNIMTFEDKFTMTTKVKDATCGCSSNASTPRQSQVSIDTSETTTKGNHSHNLVHEYPPRCIPMPILKKQDDVLYKPYSCCQQKEQTYLTDVAERDIDTCSDVDENRKSKSFGSFFKLRKREGKEETESKKVLYNEGINDSIATKYLTSQMRALSPRNTNYLDKASKVSASGKSVSQNKLRNNPISKIPFAHRSDSKYHHTCKAECSKDLIEVDTDEIKHLVGHPGIVARSYAQKPVRDQKVRPIKLPKRVLTSVKDIEFYIDNKT